MNERKYVILAKAEVSEMTEANIQQVLNGGGAFVLWNLDQSRGVVKYEGSKPRFLYGKTAYNWSQISDELSTSEWSPE